MKNAQRKVVNEIQDMRPLVLEARIDSESIDKDARRIRVKYTTGARVFRPSWWGEDYYEELSLEKGHVRLDRINSGACPVLNSHNSYGLHNVLGVIEEADEEYCTIRMSDRNEDMDALWRDIENGIIKNVSVGYRVYEYEDITPDSKDATRVLRAVDWEPIEVSWVAIGADPDAGVRSEAQQQTYRCVVSDARASLNQEKENTMDKKNVRGSRVEDKNQTRAEEEEVETPAAAPAETETETPAETPAETETPEDGERSNTDTAKTAARAERQRASEIREIVRSLDMDESLADDLVERGVTVDQARAEVINKMARNDDNTNTRSNIRFTGQDEVETRREAMENAIMHRANPGKVELLDSAREYRGMSLLEMVRESIGYQKSRGMSKRELAERAFHSTSDFPEILANIANKTMRQSYADTPRSFTPFCYQGSLPDFKQAKRLALSNASNLEQIPEGGEYQKGSFTENGETIQLFTYGSKVAITRQTIINDDLSAFTRVPQKMAAAAARLENRMVYDNLTSNPVMNDGVAVFDAAHGNLDSLALNVAGLAKMRELFRLQTDPSGEDILNLQPDYLIVPAALELAATQLKAQLTPNQTSQVNPLSNSFDIIVEGYLDGTSTSNWFMASDPSAVDTIEYAYLEGESGPYIESRNGFDVDGLEIKVRHDFATKVIDHRGLGKSNN